MSIYSKYYFEVGKNFRQREAKDSSEYLEAAKQVAEHLEDFIVETSDGIYWKDEEPSLENATDLPNISFYGGTGAIPYLYLELYKVTGIEKYLSYAERGVEYLRKHWKEQVTVCEKSLPYPKVAYSFYLGIAGVGTIIAQYYQYAKKAEDLEVLRDIAYEIIDAANEGEVGIDWNGDTSMLFDGGILLYLTKVNEVLADDKVAQAVRAAADNVLSKAEEDPRGGYAWLSTAHPNQTRVPNFECGTAGVGYVLTLVYEATRDERYLNAAIQAAAHLKAIAVKQGEGFLVPWHDNPNEEVIFYLSSCHGPAGTSKLFYKLYQITGKQEYFDDITGLYKGLRHKEAPEKQSVGYWNTTCLCCGTAGILQFLINYSLITGSEDAKKVTITAGNILLGEQEKEKKGISFPVAFERIHPENVSKSIAYVVGTAGVAGALVQTYLFLEGKYEWDRLYDDPYPESV